ncbi:MAG: hypothetical protein LBI39_03950 [Puniceicoccales bacterium]|nr:hypothetical protein [Puniceicoccales bacterium]
MASCIRRPPRSQWPPEPHAAVAVSSQNDTIHLRAINLAFSGESAPKRRRCPVKIALPAAEIDIGGERPKTLAALRTTLALRHP